MFGRLTVTVLAATANALFSPPTQHVLAPHHEPPEDESRYEIVTHPAFSGYRLRVTKPKLCDPTVKQYSGYLDISEHRHLFFWFFEARESPEDAPLMMWLNGGPGCSSTTGLLFELGPCSIAGEGNSTNFNPYSWNTIANMIFLDEPIGTGYSYSSDASKVDTLSDLAVDVGELGRALWPEHREPHIQEEPGDRACPTFASVPDYMCGSAPYPPFPPDGPECRSLKRETPICAALIQSCYRFTSRVTCNPATLYCWQRVYGPMAATGLNPYDLRIPCDPDSDLCYPEIEWIQTWMNDPANKKALGSILWPRPSDAQQCCTIAGVSRSWHAAISLCWEHRWSMQLHRIERWMSQLEHKFHADFELAPSQRWKTSETGKIGGEVRSAGGLGAGNVTFVQIYDGGHMAPHDQPEVALDMIERWIKNIPFVS
ncbi:Carboxypeptidase Y A [Grifola frondosa]|uniref:Carboxypeptidase Y A n=1 Tax=Grifola frondosa TaxID=5627 RepID=A0A1C7MS97_GRIFR|nr:Carboxypeptidase Y A [Grifola frondosa]